jgi:hypothetical protein
MVFLTTTQSVALAKPGQNMELVCWKNDRDKEQSAYFMTKSNGIVHRFKEDGRHDIYKPASKFDMPREGGWINWSANVLEDSCEEETPASYNQYLELGIPYWYKYN